MALVALHGKIRKKRVFLGSQNPYFRTPPQNRGFWLVFEKVKKMAKFGEICTFSAPFFDRFLRGFLTIF